MTLPDVELDGVSYVDSNGWCVGCGLFDVPTVCAGAVLAAEGIHPNPEALTDPDTTSMCFCKPCLMKMLARFGGQS